MLNVQLKWSPFFSVYFIHCHCIGELTEKNYGASVFLKAILGTLFQQFIPQLACFCRTLIIVVVFAVVVHFVVQRADP